MRKIFTLLIVAILATATSWAAEPYKAALFGKDYNSKAVNGYTDSWSATNAGFTVNLQNWNNNQNAWDYVKAGRKKEASVATITTAEAIDKAINKVAVTVSDATVASINSTKLYVASDADFSEGVQTITVTPAVGTLEFVVPKPAAKQYYKFEANCNPKSNGLITVKKLEYYAADVPQKNVKSLAITGEPAKVAYETGESFNHEGLTVTATYDDESTADVTADATWTFDPATFTVVGENIEVAVKAMYKEMEATTTATVSVAKAPLKYFIDLTKDETTTATAEKIEWAKDVVTVSGVQAKGGTAANNYYPGTVDKTYTTTRFYKNSTLTFAPKAGITISSVVYEAANENYANGSTWTNATVKVEGEKVVITPTDGTTTFSAKIGGTTGGKSFTILYEGTSTSTLAELAENGEEGKEYTVNDKMVVAKKFQKAGKNYIVVKDAAPAVRNLSAPAADDKFFNINGNKQEEYTQNNWMLVSLPTDLYNQVNEKSIITSITGSLAEKFNLAMEATNVEAGEATDFVPNTYCPINFMAASSVKGENSTSTYYFATPKANEYAKVVWAVYDATDGIFCIPAHEGGINGQGFKAAFRVNYSLNTNAAPVLADGRMYEFDALVKETAPTKVAPRKIGYDSTVEPKAKYVVYPLNLEAGNVSTGVNDVNSAKEVKGVSYFNMMGVESAQPFDGVNIMVTTYTDGTQSAAKVLR